MPPEETNTDEAFAAMAQGLDVPSAPEETAPDTAEVPDVEASVGEAAPLEDAPLARNEMARLMAQERSVREERVALQKEMDRFREYEELSKLPKDELARRFGVGPVRDEVVDPIQVLTERQSRLEAELKRRDEAVATSRMEAAKAEQMSVIDAFVKASPDGAAVAAAGMTDLVYEQMRQNPEMTRDAALKTVDSELRSLYESLSKQYGAPVPTPKPVVASSSGGSAEKVAYDDMTASEKDRLFASLASGAVKV